MTPHFNLSNPFGLAKDLQLIKDDLGLAKKYAKSHTPLLIGLAILGVAILGIRSWLTKKSTPTIAGFTGGLGISDQAAAGSLSSYLRIDRMGGGGGTGKKQRLGISDQAAAGTLLSYKKIPGTRPGSITLVK